MVSTSEISKDCKIKLLNSGKFVYGRIIGYDLNCKEGIKTEYSSPESYVFFSTPCGDLFHIPLMGLFDLKDNEVKTLEEIENECRRYFTIYPHNEKKCMQIFYPFNTWQ